MGLRVVPTCLSECARLPQSGVCTPALAYMPHQCCQSALRARDLEPCSSSQSFSADPAGANLPSWTSLPSLPDLATHCPNRRPFGPIRRPFGPIHRPSRCRRPNHCRRPSCCRRPSRCRSVLAFGLQIICLRDVTDCVCLTQRETIKRTKTFNALP